MSSPAIIPRPSSHKSFRRVIRVFYIILLPVAVILGLLISIGYSVEDLANSNTVSRCGRLTNTYYPAANHHQDIINLILSAGVILLLFGLFKFGNPIYKIAVLIAPIALGLYVFGQFIGTALGSIGCIQF